MEYLVFLSVAIGAVTSLLSLGFLSKLKYESKNKGLRGRMLAAAVASGGLVIVAGFFQAVQPSPPSALFKCSQSSEFIPLTLTCLPEQSDFDDLTWTANGEDHDDLPFVLIINQPQQIQLHLELTNSNWFGSAEASSSQQFLFSSPPEPETITRSIPFSAESRGPTLKRQTFSATPGFEIIDAQIDRTSSQKASVRIELVEPSKVAIAIMLRPTPLPFSGADRAWVRGEVLLTEREIIER